MTQKEKLKTLELTFLTAIFIALIALVIFVSLQAYELIGLAIGFDQKLTAYDAAVIQTFTGPFRDIVGAFIIYAFGKLGVKVTDNFIRLKLMKDPKKEDLHDISIFG